MKIEMYHNLARHSFDGYVPGQPVVKVFEFSCDNPSGSNTRWLAEFAYEIGNAVSSRDSQQLAESYRMRQLRSLSVGDVVRVGEEWLACTHVGFETIARPTIVNQGEQHA